MISSVDRIVMWVYDYTLCYVAYCDCCFAIAIAATIAISSDRLSYSIWRQGVVVVVIVVVVVVWGSCWHLGWDEMELKSRNIVIVHPVLNDY